VAGAEPAAQDQLIREFPATIGWMNGLPATARNAANRLAMIQEKASLERELAQLQAHPPPATDYLDAKAGYVPNPAFVQWQAQIAGIEHQLAGISALQQALALGGHGHLPPAYLLGFSTAGIGKAIVAFGNPASGPRSPGPWATRSGPPTCGNRRTSTAPRACRRSSGWTTTPRSSA